MSITLTTGEYYEGQLYQHYGSEYPWGEGKVIYSNRFSFQGRFAFGETSSPGVVRDPDGYLLNGYNVQYYLGGDTYTGDYYAGMRSGNGIWITSDGWTYEGYFLNDVKNGVFLVTNKDGEQFERVWENGLTKSSKAASKQDVTAAVQRRNVVENKRQAERIRLLVPKINLQLMNWNVAWVRLTKQYTRSGMLKTSFKYLVNYIVWSVEEE